MFESFQDILKYRNAANHVAEEAGLPAPFPAVTLQPNGVVEKTWKGEIQSVEFKQRGDRHDSNF